MTSLTRKIAAATIAAATALSIAGLGVASATADEVTADTTTGTLTVSSANAEFAGKTVTAWQMFTATPDATGENAGYQVATGWDEFFKGADVLNDSSLSGDVLNEKAADYVRNLGKNNDAKVTDFAKKAADWARKQTNLTKTEVKASDTATDGKYTATFTGLSFGYYVVSPAPGSTSSTRHTDAILVNVTKTDVTSIDLKSTYPTVDKKVDNDNHSSAQIGDKVNFTLDSFVPDTSEYEKYTFKFVDTLSKGLTFNNDVAVTVGNASLTKNEDYTVEQQDGDTTMVTIDLSKSIKTLEAGAAIKVTYSATLNENAVIGGTTGSNAGNTNSVKVVYSNDPNSESTGESKPSITHTYAFDFDLKKVAVAEKGQEAQALAGAEFQLKDKDGNVIKLVKTGATDKDTYRPAKTGETENVVETVTTPASGIIAFTGLKAGEYQLVETEAPAGYNKLTAPIKVTITATYNDDGTLKNYAVTYDNGPNDGTSHEVTVENHKGSLLPETGGMGTMLFTVLGVLVVALGAAWYVRSERKGAVRA